MNMGNKYQFKFMNKLLFKNLFSVKNKNKKKS